MNFLQACEKLRERVAEKGTGPAAVTGQTGMNLRIVNWINAAYAEVQGLWTDWRFRWYEGTLTTVASTAAVALPAAIEGWYEDCFYYDGSPLSVMQWDEYRLERDSWDDVAEGPPQILVIKPDRSLIILPTPDDAYSIRYEGYKAVEAMAANTDVPIIPSGHQDIIVWKAMMYYGSFEDAPEVYNEGKNLYGNALIALEASQLPGQEYRRRSSGNNLQIT